MKLSRYTINDILADIGKRSSRNPVSSEDIELRYGVRGVSVRKIVSQEGRRGRHMLIISCSKGYYMARDYDEYKEAMHHYLARAESIMKTEQILREHYMPHDKQQVIF